MRIGLFSDTYLPDINGVVSSVELLRKKLEEQGNDVYVFCTYPGLVKVKREGKIIRLPGIEIKQLYGYAVTGPLHLFMINDVKSLKLDVIHIHTEFGVGIFGQICAETLHIPMVRTYHTTYEDYTHYINVFDLDSVDKVAKKAVAKLSRFYGNSCMRLISPSNKTKEMLLKYGITTPIEIIPTGTELDRFNRANTSLERIAEVRKECGVEEGTKMLLYVGRIAQEKSIDMLLNAMVIAKEKGIKVKLVVIGGGPDLDNLIKLSQDMGLDKYVYFGNKRPFSEVPAYYHSADAFLSASTTETQGMTYIEALASGLVVFARRDECVEELIDEGETGYYFDDASELYTKILKLLELSEEEYQTMCEKGIKKTAQYDANLFGKRIEGVYEEAIAQYHKYYVVKSVKLKNDYVVLSLENGGGENEDLVVTLDDFYDRGMRKGEMISFDDFDNLKRRETVVLAYRGCIRQISLKDRTVKQIRDYINSKFELSEEYTEAIIDKLVNRGLLNDLQYAISKTESLNARLFSYNHVIKTLKKEGISEEIIHKVVANVYDEELRKAIRLANKYNVTVRGKSLKAKKQSIIKKLLTEGFNYDVANTALDSLDLSIDILEETNNLRREALKSKMHYAKKYEGSNLRNHIYQHLVSKGYSTENIYAILNEMEWDNE